MTGTIVMAGSLAQKPHHGGHAWVFLQYLLGFRRLGWDVLFIDRLEPAMCRDARHRPCPAERSVNLAFFRDLMTRFGLERCGALLGDDGHTIAGPAREEVLARTRGAALLIDVMGYLEDEEILGSAPRRAFLDIDPGFPQMWQALGLAELLSGYDDYLTIGENIGRPDCAIPACGLDWIATPQPVVLERWPVAGGAARAPITSVASWRGAYGPLEFGGRSYGPRAHEFRRFVSLPERSGASFDLALDIHPDDHRDRALLAANGWRLSDPAAVAADPWAYRDFIGRSRAEFMVAKNLYVDTRSGWFSDRSICYLASGKPVLAQDTGLDERYRHDSGLLLFSDLEQAAAAVRAVSGDYPRHCRAARRIAEQHFDSDLVLGRLLARLGIG